MNKQKGHFEINWPLSLALLFSKSFSWPLILLVVYYCLLGSWKDFLCGRVVALHCLEKTFFCIFAAGKAFRLVSSWLHIVMPIVMLIHQVCWKKSKLPDDTLWAEIKRMIKVHDLPWIRKKNYQIRNFITKLVSLWLHIFMPIVMLIHQVCWKKSKLPDDTLWAEIERIIKVHDLPWIGKKYSNFFKKEKKKISKPCFVTFQCGC